MEGLENPCLSCGACCAYYRVSFYWAEDVPAELTEAAGRHRAAMRGTSGPEIPRCAALIGEVGLAVSCEIYGRRPSVCREFSAGEPGCEQARAAWGMKQLAESLKKKDRATQPLAF